MDFHVKMDWHVSLMKLCASMVRIETKHRGTMPSILGSLIRVRLNQRGWSATDLAAEAGIAKSTLSRLMNDEVVPDLATVVKLSDTLAIPLPEVIEATGLSVERGLTSGEREARFVSALEAVPWLKPLLGPLAQLTPEEQASVLSYLEWMIAQRHRRRAD
jgi:transcriptional regulator with XRE-family HTH domain